MVVAEASASMNELRKLYTKDKGAGAIMRDRHASFLQPVCCGVEAHIARRTVKYCVRGWLSSRAWKEH